MSREWKPGDVAMARATGGEFLVVRTGVGTRAYWSAPMDWPNGISPHECEYRPLVVIDPEDSDSVARLADLIPNCGDETNHCDPQQCMSMGCWVDRVSSALREFANPTPPKPDEPTGLGAVVEDAAGERWILVYDEIGDVRQWAQVGRISLIDKWLEWDDIAAVRVLSPGVDA